MSQEPEGTDAAGVEPLVLAKGGAGEELVEVRGGELRAELVPREARAAMRGGEEVA